MIYKEKIKQLGKTENDVQLISDICYEIRNMEPKNIKDIYLELIEYTKKK